MTNKDEIAELKKELADQKARVEELERANKPKEPFKPPPHQQYDPTAGMRMPDSALRAMVNAVPDNFLRDVVRDNRGPGTPTGMIPRAHSSRPAAPDNVAGSGTGWSATTPLSPPPGVAQADRLMDAQDARDRVELIEREARMRAMQKMAEGNDT
jgi:hypothetical protein